MIEYLACGLMLISLHGQNQARPFAAEGAPSASPKPSALSSPSAETPISAKAEDPLHATLNEAGALRAEGKHAESFVLYQKAAAIAPKSAEAFNELGLCYYYLNNLDKAIESFKKASALDPGDSATHYNMGRCYVSRKQWDLAIIHFKKAIKENPKNLQAQLDLANCYFVTKEFKKAKEQYENAATLFGYDTPQGREALRNAIKIEMLMEKLGGQAAGG